MNLKSLVREIENYPKEGISFKDVTTLFKDANALNSVIDQIYCQFKDHHITKVVSLESRGFIVGGALAYKLKTGFIPVRKPGKLPSKVISQSYDLEYGSDSVEIHVDALSPDDVVLIHDDLIATGGTAYAAYQLVKRLGVKKIFFSFVCDLTFIEDDVKNKIGDYHSLIQF